MRITNIVNLALKLGSRTHVMNGTFTDRPGNSRTDLGRELFRQTCIHHQDVYLRYETYGEKGEEKREERKDLSIRLLDDRSIGGVNKLET